MAKQETEIRNREVQHRRTTLRTWLTNLIYFSAIKKLFKEKLIKERDAEIEMIIQRLESETNSNQSDVTRRQRMELEKLKADMADEIKNLRDQHSMALDKVISIQNNLGHSEEKNRELQKELLQAQHTIQSKVKRMMDRGL